MEKTTNPLGQPIGANGSTSSQETTSASNTHNKVQGIVVNGIIAKYIYGIILGVFLTNLFFSPMKAYDLIFGVGQSVIALLITIACARFIKGIWARMIVNTLVFTFTMFLIALELHLAFDLICLSCLHG